MMDDLQQAYAAYQNAISYLSNRKVCEPRMLSNHPGHEANLR